MNISCDFVTNVHSPKNIPKNLKISINMANNNEIRSFERNYELILVIIKYVYVFDIDNLDINMLCCMFCVFFKEQCTIVDIGDLPIS